MQLLDVVDKSISTTAGDDGMNGSKRHHHDVSCSFSSSFSWTRLLLLLTIMFTLTVNVIGSSRHQNNPIITSTTNRKSHAAASTTTTSLLWKDENHHHHHPNLVSSDKKVKNNNMKLYSTARGLEELEELVEEEEVEEIGSIEEEEEGEEAIDEETIEASIVVIILILIGLTIAFEYTKEYIEESVDNHMEPIIESLFGEMTILGFLSVVTFCITKTGYFEKISIKLFGEEEEEALLELFETIHYMLFFIMVSFVCLVLKLVHDANELKDYWRMMDRASRNTKYISKLQKRQYNDFPDDIDSNNISRRKGWIQYCIKHTVPFAKNEIQFMIEEILLFNRVRKEFLLERKAKRVTPADVTDEEKTSHEIIAFPPADIKNRVSDDFNFGRYLSICLGQTLAHVVEVSIATWTFFGLFVFILYWWLLFTGNDMQVFAWTWVAFGWFMLFLSNRFAFHVLQIYKSLAAPQHKPSDDIDSDDETQGLLSSSSSSSNDLPKWCSIDLEHYMENRPLLSKLYFGQSVSAPVPTRQDTLFVLELKGPKLYMTLLQIKLVFTAAYVSLLLLTFYPYMWSFEQEETLSGDGDNNNNNIIGFIIYLLLSAIPVLIDLKNNRRTVSRLSQIICIGIHRRPQAVSQVIREEKTDRIIRALVTLHQLQDAAVRGFRSTRESIRISMADVDPVELNEISKTFDSFDTKGDGQIAASELHGIMSQLGAPTTPKSLSAMMDVLDANGDGVISKDEFLGFFSEQILNQKDSYESMHDRAEYMFNMFDQDRSGEITIGEVKEVLDAFQVGFTVDEVGDLIHELDETGDGAVGKHEFHELLEKHAYLFEKCPLPDLFY